MRDSQEDIELNILTLLVEQYENIHYQIDLPNPIDLIKDLMADRNWKTKDLANLLGHKSIATEILNGKRKLSLKVMKILYNEFEITYDVLIQASSIGEEKLVAQQDWI